MREAVNAWMSAEMAVAAKFTLALDGCSNPTHGWPGPSGQEAVGLGPVEQRAEALADQRPEAADDLQVTARQGGGSGVVGGKHADQVACAVHQRR